MIGVHGPPPAGQTQSAPPIPLLFEYRLPPAFELHETMGAIVPLDQVAAFGLVV
jgi:hypothetical protein